MRDCEGEDSKIEKRLRQSAPDLPTTLRNRTLENCNARVAERQRRHRRLQWQLTLAVFGVLALQCLTLSVVNTQNSQLIAGNSAPPLFASLSFSEINHLLHQRSHQLALLMQSSGVG
ncbi:hypothetical protein EON83_04240 [bacterium]|nr:MAG: hypothetical protein EON83_04240 [bacterium]